MTSPTRCHRLGVAVAATAVLALTACGAQDGTGDADSPAEAGAYTPAEVKKATGSYQVRSLYAVPKNVDSYKLAFINPAKSFPFFASWSEGMHDAAEFYGVELIEADVNFEYDQALTKYQDLAVKQPDLLGGGGGNLNAPTIAAAKADGIPVVSIDGAVEGAVFFGVDDKRVGELAVEQLIEPVKEKQSSDWKGKHLIVAGVSSGNCPPCDARVKAAFEKAKAEFGLSEDDTFRLVPPGTDPTVAAQDTFTDFLTAHPDDVIAVVSYGDEPVVGALNAAKASNRTSDVLAVTNGGDPAARQALRDTSNDPMLVGSIDYEPHAEGWNFVEVAIATLEGDDFADYKVTRVLTRENVDEFYPDDQG